MLGYTFVGSRVAQFLMLADLIALNLVCKNLNKHITKFVGGCVKNLNDKMVVARVMYDGMVYHLDSNYLNKKLLDMLLYREIYFKLMRDKKHRRSTILCLIKNKLYRGCHLAHTMIDKYDLAKLCERK
jgi:hypothetical protein